MEDDTCVASAPQFGVNMSETGITEAFFFPQMGAVSTPFRASPKKSRASKSSIDFNRYNQWVLLAVFLFFFVFMSLF